MLKITSIMPLVILLCSCDNSSSDNTATGQIVKKIQIQPHQNADSNTSKKSLYEQIEPEAECGDCTPPNYLEVPSYGQHGLLDIPLNTKKYLSAFFLKNFHANIVEVKNIIEPSKDNYNLAQGTMVFGDGYLTYTLPSSNESYKSSLIRYTSNNSNQRFTDFENNMLYKIIQIGGEANPQTFLQELISSEKNYAYEGCCIQQKESKLGIVELAVCDSDNKKFLTLYNPKAL